MVFSIENNQTSTLTELYDSSVFNSDEFKAELDKKIAEDTNSNEPFFENEINSKELLYIPTNDNIFTDDNFYSGASNSFNSLFDSGKDIFNETTKTISNLYNDSEYRNDFWESSKNWGAELGNITSDYFSSIWETPSKLGEDIFSLANEFDEGITSFATDLATDYTLAKYTDTTKYYTGELSVNLAPEIGSALLGATAIGKIWNNLPDFNAPNLKAISNSSKQIELPVPNNTPLGTLALPVAAGLVIKSCGDEEDIYGEGFNDRINDKIDNTDIDDGTGETDAEFKQKLKEQEKQIEDAKPGDRIIVDRSADIDRAIRAIIKEGGGEPLTREDMETWVPMAVQVELDYQDLLRKEEEEKEKEKEKK